MFSWIFTFWLLQTLFPLCNFSTTQCYFNMESNQYSDGDVVIAAFVPLYIEYMKTKLLDFEFVPKSYQQFKFKNYQSYLAFIFAIEEINRSPHLLPNTSLGFHLIGVQRSEWNILREAFFWLTGMGIIIPNYTCGMNKAVALLTGRSWTTSANLGKLLNLYKYPQLSFGPFDTILSDRGQFSSLYQTAPKDSSLSHGIISLMLHFSWTWVGLVLIDSHKGTQILSEMRGIMYQNSVCVAFTKIIPKSLVIFHYTSQETLKLIMSSSANVIIVYDDTDSIHCVMLEGAYLLNSWRVWIMNSQLDINIIKEPFIFDSFHGTLYFAYHHDEIYEFRKFIQIYTPSRYPEDLYLALFWNWYFNCSFSLPDCKISGNCLPNASLEMLPSNLWDMDMTEESYNIYNSVYAVAHSLHKMTVKQLQIQPCGNGDWNSHPWELHSFLKKLHFKNGAGHYVVLDPQMKSDEEYDIFNFWNFPNGLKQYMKVGTFSPKAPQGQQLLLADHMVQWAIGFSEIPRSVCSVSCVSGFRKSPQEGKATCCYGCAPCPDNEISNETVWVSRPWNGTEFQIDSETLMEMPSQTYPDACHLANYKFNQDMDDCMKCPESHYANTQQNHCFQKDVTYLSYEDPLGTALSCTALGCSLLTAAVLSVFVKHHQTPIVKANNRTLTYILLITLTFCFLCPLLYIGHPNTGTCILQQIIFAVLFTVALSTVLAKTLTVVLAFKVTVPGRTVGWLMICRAPNFIIPICTLIQLVLRGIWMSTSPPFIDSDAHSEHEHIIIVCNKGSIFAFHSVLGYLCSLALACYTMAYFSMNLPDTFNEAKFLTFSMLVFFSVWVTFLPVYHSTKGKVMVAMEVFAILASSAGLLGCIFAPKCYIILLRPDRNSRQGIRDKAHSRKVHLTA